MNIIFKSLKLLFIAIFLILATFAVVILLWNAKIRGSKEVGSCFVNVYGQTYRNMGSAHWDGESGGSKYKRIGREDCENL